jgi:hypothetical protein
MYNTKSLVKSEEFFMPENEEESEDWEEDEDDEDWEETEDEF